MVVEVKKVGVIGAGQMGNGIAHVSALSGFDVVLHDIDQERIDSASPASTAIWHVRSQRERSQKKIATLL